MVSSATFGCNDDYVGLALPMDINDMFHIRDSAYFQQRISPPSEERKRFIFDDGDGKSDYKPKKIIKNVRKKQIFELILVCAFLCR